MPHLDPSHTYLGLETAETPSGRQQLLAEGLCQGPYACQPAKLKGLLNSTECVQTGRTFELRCILI